MWQDGQRANAIRSLDSLNAEFPHTKVVVGLLGAYLWEVGSFDQALPILQESKKLSPRSEITSRALFHTLWSLGRQEEALEEMKRFYRETGAMPSDYKEIVDEILESVS